MLWLLTHPREVERPTNTGQWILETLPEMARRVLWQRKQPDPLLLEALAQGHTALVYPSREGSQVLPSEAEHFILLDGTWQEAHKMYRLSPYLRQAPWLPLQVDKPSRYALRRNQRPAGLCTYECALHLLALKGAGPAQERLAAVAHRLAGPLG